MLSVVRHLAKHAPRFLTTLGITMFGISHAE